MTLTLRWSRREPPLPIAAVAAGGASATRLRASTVERLEHGAELLVSISADWVLVLGPADDLPWTDGVTYLGCDSGLLLPCALAPSVPAGVLRAALGVDTLAVLPGVCLVGPAPVRVADPLVVAG